MYVIQHERIHTGEKPYSCTTCGNSFKQRGNLTRHKLIHVGGKPYSCCTCSDSFTDLRSLITHQSIHAAEKPYLCTTCGKSFRHLGNLTKHKRIHTGEKPYVCDTCGKAFAQQNSLNTHQRIHTGEKPYLCTTCGKSFSHSGNLATHNLIHTGEKPYSCRTCGKAFSDKKYLLRHERIHTGEKPSIVECDVNELDNPTIESESDTSIDYSKTSKDQRSLTANRIQNVAGFNQVVEVSDEASRRDGSSYVHDQIRVGSVVQSDGEKRDSTEDTKVSDAEHRQSINIEGMYLCVARYIVYDTLIKSCQVAMKIILLFLLTKI